MRLRESSNIDIEMSDCQLKKSPSYPTYYRSGIQLGLYHFSYSSSYIVHVEGVLPEQGPTLNPSGRATTRGFNLPLVYPNHI